MTTVPSQPSTGKVAQSLRAARRRLNGRYTEMPLATSAALFAVLAVVRIAGAFQPALVLLSIAITPLVLVAVPRLAWRDIGLRPSASRRATWRALMAVAAAYGLSVGACVLAFGTGRNNWFLGLRDFFAPTTSTGGASTPVHGFVVALAVLVCLGLLVPLAEEVCYRGVLHTAVESRSGPLVAVVVTAVAWAVVHLGDYGLQSFNGRVVVGVLLSVFLMGLALGWCRVTTGSVWACVLAQGCMNILLAVLVFRW